MAHYVDVRDVPLELLELLGYYLVAEDDEFVLLTHKGEEYILSKDGPRLLYVEDHNDATILRSERVYPAPRSEEEDMG